ncbi:LysE family translocator [Cupriavidus basilensis]|uniref:LysE family translocator n=1 Tax=Cupriavidus basilensis TaxID=68895 RepID=A0ABT6B1J2_9BURK|nr:LysE family translocator [Cupriavidus basilensis]MDF3838759.1 LysE family translocator [Cupriavidus basilensis]
MDLPVDSGFGQFAMVAGAHFLALLSPGPDFFLVVRSALVHGVGRASAVCLGIALGNGVFICLAMAGLAATRTSQGVFTLLQWGGCLYLAWLGWRLLSASGETVLPEAGSQPARGGRGKGGSYAAQLATGFLSAVLNPKNLLFYASLFSVLAGSRTPFVAQAGYGLWMFAMVFGWDMLVAWGVRLPPVRARFARSVRGVERVTGLVLWGIALVVAVNALQGAKP